MKSIFPLLFVLAALLGSSYELQAQQVIINELMARNANGIVDEFGDDDDWIEIYNPGSTPVNLAGLYISDTLNTPDFFRIPSFDAAKTTVPAGGYLILWADNEPAEGANHLPFKLNNGGEAVYIGTLSGGSISIIDQVVFPKLERDVSYGRLPNATGTFRRLSDPTPGAPNAPVRVIGNIVINEIMAVNNGPDVDEDGEAEDWIEFYNPTSQPIDLGGLYLTDSAGELTMHRIPIYAPDSTTVPPGGFLRFWADGEPRTSVLHIDFRLARRGEKITMTQPDGYTVMQEVRFPALQPDATFGRYPDGSDHWIYLNQPTPNAPNAYTYEIISGILINEFMAINESTYPDNLGEFEDWIELYNTNNYAVNVGGLIITDTLGEPYRYRIPETYPDSTTIPPGGYLVLFADNQPEQGVLHLDLKLTGEGEAIGLFQYRETLVELDSYVFGLQAPDRSMGRSPDGSDNWVTFSSPSPGEPNTGGSSLLISGLYVNEFLARNVNGYTDEYGNYEDWIELYNNTNEPIDIAGLYFTDDLDMPQKTQIPAGQPEKTTVPPKGYLIVWPDLKPDLGPLHVNFQLAGAGEAIGVFQYVNNEKHTVQALTYPPQTADVSYGRAPDASANWHFFGVPTPNAPNASSSIDKHRMEYASLTAFPNPLRNGDKLSLKWDFPGWAKIEIMDASGRMLFSKTMEMSGFTETIVLNDLNASGIKYPGLYYVKVSNKEERGVLKLLVY